MKKEIIESIMLDMNHHLSADQKKKLHQILNIHLAAITQDNSFSSLKKLHQTSNHEIVQSFLSSKKLEGCSDKTLHYYNTTINHMLEYLNLSINRIETEDLRNYLSNYQQIHQSSKVTIDNIRRIFSSFFTWLEDEEYILKSPVRRIHRIKISRVVKDVFSDEEIEILRKNCTHPRDLAMIDFFLSTGIRVGELVNLNISDLDFEKRQCVVLGKGNHQRIAYFDAKAKIHLQEYLQVRTDSNNALFVSLRKPFHRITIAAVENRLKHIGQMANVRHVHPHKFRRTIATMAIDKGMPVEQVQKMLGHIRIDTTMHYAMVNETNVKNSHRKYIG